MNAYPAQRIAVVLPTLNEAANLVDALSTLRTCACEVVVADGGSSDHTTSIARDAGARVVESERGRALQMNAGVAGLASEWSVVLFLHADTRLPERWSDAVERAIAAGAGWGRFDVRLASNDRLLRVVGQLMNLRSRLSGICTGDQAIFVTRDAWLRAGGYPAIALMEDIEISRRLKRCAGRPAALRDRVLVSARRWERRGVVRTIVSMWILRLRHFLGESPDSLHRRYYGKPQ